MAQLPKISLALVGAIFCLTAASVKAQTESETMDHAHTPGMTHADATPQPPQPLPSEPGQGAFAAIAEIVVLLNADPQTDWTKVDITALRDHLVDMDKLVTESSASLRQIPGGLEMTIPTTGPGGQAASRMVPAHAPVLAGETGWSSTVTTGPDALIWTVTSDEAETQIRALGFFGLMATGDHHRAHHLAMATGAMVH